MKISSILNLNPLTFPSKFILNSFSSLSTISNHNNNAIDRILLRFRYLSHHHDHDEPTQTLPQLPFLHRHWLRSDDNNHRKVFNKKNKMNQVMAPCLAEEELTRLRTIGIYLKDKISIPKSGLTRPVLHKIHHQWNNNELVKLKFHDFLSQNMKLAHDIVQRRTGGLVIWRSGSVMWVYRGNNYQGPTTNTKHNSKSESVVWNQQQHDNMTPEEMEFNRMLDGFGPRFVDWWGTGILPVDADLLSPIVPGYRTPMRLLPTRMHPRLTNDEHAKMLKLAKALPCHFALGRNRNLQGLACAILKLWEKSLVAKIAVKLGVQNTNNELMALELKELFVSKSSYLKRHLTGLSDFTLSPPLNITSEISGISKIVLRPS